MKQTSSIGIMDFIRPHKGGFLCSVVLSVLGVASGIVPYFAVAKMINLLIVGEQDFPIVVFCCFGRFHHEVCISWVFDKSFARSNVCSFI